MRRLGILFLLLSVATGSVRAADVPSQKFVVFFQEWSAALDDSAQTVIGQAAEWVKSHPGNVAHVNGFADPTGSKKANALLSDLRAQMVVDQLQTDGVDCESHPTARPRLGAVRSVVAGEPPGGDQHQPALSHAAIAARRRSPRRCCAGCSAFPGFAASRNRWSTTSSPVATHWC